MKRINSYEALYRKNEKSGRVIIDVSLDEYIEFFHEWDNAALRKRDIHPELVLFLDLCSEDIPLRRKLEIQFSIDTTPMGIEREEQIRTSYFNYYHSLYRLEMKKTKKMIRFSIILITIALLLLASYVILSTEEVRSIPTKVFLESLLIGGWVFTWEAIHMLFFDTMEPFRRSRELKRFLQAEINFRYLRGEN
jgi:hypothetical protein